MRSWANLLTIFYVGVVAVLSLGVYPFIQDASDFIGLYQFEGLYQDWFGLFGDRSIQILVAAAIFSQAALLFLPVDSTQHVFLCRIRIFISTLSATLLLGVLTFCTVIALVALTAGEAIAGYLLMGVLGDQTPVYWFLASLVLPAVVLYKRRKRIIERTGYLYDWLIMGAVAEMLVVVPVHVILEQRGDMYTTMGTAAGFVAGIMILLTTVIPSRVFLKRERQYSGSHFDPRFPAGI